MSIYRVDPTDVESFTIVTNPHRTYVSSSTGTTGDVPVFARRSTIEKDASPRSSFIDAAHDDSDLPSMLESAKRIGRIARVSGSVSSYVASCSARFPRLIEEYVERVNAQGTSVRSTSTVRISRYTPSLSFTENTVRKLIVKDQLSSYHRTAYPSAHWAYTNYNSLNFFTASTVPTSSCLLYPNVPGGPPHDGYVTGTYVPSGAFSIDFHVKPCYRPTSGEQFRAGTLLHLSSTYAVSIVTGSARDENGLPLTFRLLLQLSHSADIPPSLLAPVGNSATTPVASPLADLAFFSDDNALRFNTWHHVVVRWGTHLVNDGTGSFNVDGVDRGTFVVPSSTIAPAEYDVAASNGPDVLVVGNHYDGANVGSTSMSLFFAADPALREGLNELNVSTGIDEPSVYRFEHPLNAEVHDVAVRRYYMSDDDIIVSSSEGPRSIDTGWTAFYLPPFFVEESPFRSYVGTHGGILQTPFFEVDGTTNDPFNVAMSFGVGGHYVNIENFLRDFASNVFPRAHHMSGTALTYTTEARTANEFLYEQPFVRRRNLLIVPCDDGLFVPGFELLASESSRSNVVDDLGVEELGFINIGEMLSTSSLLFGSDFNGDLTYVNELIGSTPEQPGTPPGAASLGYKSMIDRSVASGSFVPGLQDGVPLTVFQRTRDASSNQVTFFNISNLYYGLRILPGSLTLRDASLSGSGGAFGVTLRDNGMGTLYRADCASSASNWNSVGTVFYDEGIIVIKSPHLYFFGADGYELEFKGEQNVHVMTVNVVAPANQLNSSSNPNYVRVPPSQYPNDPEKEFVYITGINFHDDNLNVIMKTQLAQPIVKRPGDRLLFRVRCDT